MCICLYLYIDIHIYTHTHIHTYIHTYIHTFIHTDIHAYTHTHIHIHIHTYTYMHTHTPAACGLPALAAGAPATPPSCSASVALACVGGGSRGATEVSMRVMRWCMASRQLEHR